MPRFKDKTNAVFKRLVIVPFNADFKGDKEKEKSKMNISKTSKYLNISFTMQSEWTLKNSAYQMCQRNI